MPEDNREDICGPGIEYMMISLIPCKIKVLVIGGGRAGLIKTKSFLKKGCNVWVLSKEFIEDFKELENTERLTFIKGEYEKSCIEGKHIVIIATGDKNLNKKIKHDCDLSSRIYLTCGNFREGLFVTPVQGETDSISFALHTKTGSPKTSVFLAGVFKNYLKEFDGFVHYVSTLREKLKHSGQLVNTMDSVNTKEFYELYKSGKHEDIVKDI